MTQFLDNIEFAKPFYFWLLLALPLIWLRFRAERFVVIFWRSVIVSLLVGTLADPQTVGHTSTTEERILAFDVSRSMPASTRGWMAETAEKNFAPKRGERVYLFGGELKETDDWRAALNDPTIPA